MMFDNIRPIFYFDTANIYVYMNMEQVFNQHLDIKSRLMIVDSYWNKPL